MRAECGAAAVAAVVTGSVYDSDQAEFGLRGCGCSDLGGLDVDEPLAAEPGCISPLKMVSI